MKTNEELINAAYLTGTQAEQDLAARLDLMTCEFDQWRPIIQMLADDDIMDRETLNDVLNRASQYDSLKAALQALVPPTPHPQGYERATAPSEPFNRLVPMPPMPTLRRHPYDGEMPE